MRHILQSSMTSLAAHFPRVRRLQTVSRRKLCYLLEQVSIHSSKPSFHYPEHRAYPTRRHAYSSSGFISSDLPYPLSALHPPRHKSRALSRHTQPNRCRIANDTGKAPPPDWRPQRRPSSQLWQ
jgi:hypothetical protein